MDEAVAARWACSAVQGDLEVAGPTACRLAHSGGEAVYSAILCVDDAGEGADPAMTGDLIEIFPADNGQPVFAGLSRS